MEQPHAEMALSMMTVVLAIFAIVVFIYYGGDWLFYLVAVLAMAAGFVNLRLIARSGNAGAAAARPKAARRRAKAR